jgi:hypothetical protein
MIQNPQSVVVKNTDAALEETRKKKWRAEPKTRCDAHLEKVFAGKPVVHPRNNLKRIANVQKHYRNSFALSFV